MDRVGMGHNSKVQGNFSSITLVTILCRSHVETRKLFGMPIPAAFNTTLVDDVSVTLQLCLSRNFRFELQHDRPLPGS